MTSKGHTRQTRRIEWRHVSLVLAGKDLDPDRISSILGIKPDDSGRRGEPFGATWKSKLGVWSLDGRPYKGRIDTQMRSLLQRIEPVEDKLRKVIAGDDIGGAYVRITFEPPDTAAVDERFFPADLVYGFVALGIDIVVSVNMPGYFSKLSPE